MKDVMPLCCPGLSHYIPRYNSYKYNLPLNIEFCFTKHHATECRLFNLHFLNISVEGLAHNSTVMSHLVLTVCVQRLLSLVIIHCVVYVLLSLCI